jgi:hypothetical protein
MGRCGNRKHADKQSKARLSQALARGAAAGGHLQGDRGWEMIMLGVHFGCEW